MSLPGYHYRKDFLKTSFLQHTLVFIYRKSGLADIVYNLYKTYPDNMDFEMAEELLGESKLKLRRTLAYVFISHVSENNYKSLQQVQQTFGFPKRVLLNMATDTEIHLPFADITYEGQAQNPPHLYEPSIRLYNKQPVSYTPELDNSKFLDAVMDYLDSDSLEEIISVNFAAKKDYDFL